MLIQLKEETKVLNRLVSKLFNIEVPIDSVVKLTTYGIDTYNWSVEILFSKYKTKHIPEQELFSLIREVIQELKYESVGTLSNRDIFINYFMWRKLTTKQKIIKYIDKNLFTIKHIRKYMPDWYNLILDIEELSIIRIL